MQLFTSNKTISLCMIVRNEAETLDRCLGSVRGVVDEIVIVDTGSVDDTVAIAESYGARVIRHPWNDDFAEARNVGLAAATSGWVLVLDADEELTNPQAIRRVLDQPLAIVQIAITNLIGEQTVTHQADRLFPAACRFVGRIHEQVRDPLNRFGHAVLGGATIRHYGYQPEVVAAKNKNERNVRLLLAAVQDAPNDLHMRIHLGQSLELAGNLHGAIDQYRLALALSDLEGITIAWEHVAARLLACLYQSGQTMRAIIEGREMSHHHEIEHPAFWLNYGMAKAAGGFETLAIASFEHAIALQPNRAIYQIDEGVATWKPFASLGDALVAVGRTDEGAINLRRALSMRPPQSVAKKLNQKLAQLARTAMAEAVNGLDITDLQLTA